MSKKPAPESSPNGYRHFFLLMVLAKLFSARFGSFAKPTDQKQDSGYRLAREIIRAEPPDHPFIVLLSLHIPTRLRGVSPPHGEPSPAQKQGKC